MVTEKAACPVLSQRTYNIYFYKLPDDFLWELGSKNKDSTKYVPSSLHQEGGDVFQREGK